MATRPVFSVIESDDLISTEIFEFKYCPGFSIKQKQNSIANLHSSYKRVHPDSKIIEISSKSKDEIGKELSAFNLKINIGNNQLFSIENLFQSSKVFEYGGPYDDILFKTPSEAKKDLRLKQSGKIIEFKFQSRHYPSEPKTFFYDWIYIHALSQKHNSDLFNKIVKFNAFTDIEFNPQRSINCQARSCAFAVSLYKKGKIREVLMSKEFFIEKLYNTQNSCQLSIFN